MIKKILAAAALALVSLQSSAAMIEGELHFRGTSAVTLTGDGSAAAFIDFIGPIVIDHSTRDYLDNGVMEGDTAVYTDPLDLGTTPISPLWTVGGFSFDLATVETNSVRNSGPIDVVFVRGLGTIYHADFDDTPAYWGAVAHTDGSGGGLFFFASVPEPGSLALLGLGLLGLGLVHSKKVI